MVYDYSMLDGKIREKFGTRGRFAEAINLSEKSISDKMNGKVCWSQPQINQACLLLKIPATDIPSYFFRLKVQ